MPKNAQLLFWEKLRAKTLEADEAIQNGIKHGQILWEDGKRKEARERLAVSNRKHIANASPDVKLLSKSKRDE